MPYVNKYEIKKYRYKELEYFCYQYKELPEKEKLLIKLAAEQADPDIKEFIIMGVTNKGIVPEILIDLKGMPCSRDMYYDRRRKFFYFLDKLK